MQPQYLNPRSHRSESGINSRFMLDLPRLNWGIMRT